MSPKWARDIRDQCVTAGVPFFFKQFGDWGLAMSRPSGTPGRFALAPREFEGPIDETDQYPRSFTSFGTSVLEHLGKKKAGRLLDGRTWDEMPEISCGMNKLYATT